MILNEHQIYDYNLITRCRYYLLFFFFKNNTEEEKRSFPDFPSALAFLEGLILTVHMIQICKYM